MNNVATEKSMPVASRDSPPFTEEDLPSALRGRLSTLVEDSEHSAAPGSELRPRPRVSPHLIGYLPLSVLANLAVVAWPVAEVHDDVPSLGVTSKMLAVVVSFTA